MLEIVARLDKMLEQRGAQILALRAENKPVIGYFCCYVPEELIYAAGLTPLRLIRGGEEAYVSVGHSYMTSNACPFVSASVGYMKEGKDPFYTSLTHLAEAPTCMQVKRLLEIYEQYFNVELLTIDFSRKFYDHDSREFYYQGVEDFAERLERLGDCKITAERLSAVVVLFNRIRLAQRKLYEYLRLPYVQPFSWRDLRAIIKAGFYLDRAVYADYLDELLVVIAAQPQSAELVSDRVIVIGGMMAHGDEKVARVLEESGATVVGDELCSTSRNIQGTIEAGTIRAIAERYMRNVPCGAMANPHSNNDPREQRFHELVAECEADAVVYYSLRCCDAYSFKVRRMKHIASLLELPFLHIHSDYAASDIGQLRTRIEALLETI